MERTEVREAYDRGADLYADAFPGTEPEQALDLAMIGYFAHLLGPDASILDAGCGAGRMLPVLAGLGLDPRGVDISPGMIRRARADHPESDVEVASLHDLPFADATFDGVLAWYSLIHTPDEDLDGTVAELRRVLLPGGLLLTGFQTGDAPREVGAAFRERGVDLTLVRLHRSPDAVSAVLTRAGFAEVARLVRGPVGSERDGQAFLLARS